MSNRKPPRCSIWNFFFTASSTPPPPHPPTCFCHFLSCRHYFRGGNSVAATRVNQSYKGSHSFEGSLNFRCNLIPACLAARISPHGASPRFHSWRIIAPPSPAQTGWVVIPLQCSNHKGGPRSQIHEARKSPINSGRTGVTVTLRHRIQILKFLNESPGVSDVRRRGAVGRLERGRKRHQRLPENQAG